MLRPISVPSKATRGVDAEQLRSDHAEPADASARTPSNRRVVVAPPAVVIQFGAQALGLARSPLTPHPSDALTAADDDTEPLHGNVFEANDTNSALLGALDAPQSGFFRSSAVTGAKSPLASDGLDDGLDWLFPGSAASRALDAAFARPDAEFAVESTVPELPASTTPSGFVASSPPRASGFFISEDVAPAASANTAPQTTFDASEPSAEQRRETRTLEQSARQVRADERAQRVALAGYASNVQLRYEMGPDGRRYLVEAEVPFDVTAVPGDPEATLRKMEAIRRATSSGSPSSSARHASAEAAQLALRARAQLAAERYAEAQEF